MWYAPSAGPTHDGASMGGDGCVFCPDPVPTAGNENWCCQGFNYGMAGSPGGGDSSEKLRRPFWPIGPHDRFSESIRRVEPDDRRRRDHTGPLSMELRLLPEQPGSNDEHSDQYNGVDGERGPRRKPGPLYGLRVQELSSRRRALPDGRRKRAVAQRKHRLPTAARARYSCRAGSGSGTLVTPASLLNGAGRAGARSFGYSDLALRSLAMQTPIRCAG